MAVVLDINILCKKVLDLDVIITLLAKHGVSIEAVNQIDNWKWDNEKRVESFEQIATILNMQHIVIFKLKRLQIKDMGLYIEKMDNHYLYTAWINTEGYPMLDCENVTMNNCKYYKEIIQAILELNGLSKDSFEIAGIGLETDFCYEKNIIGMIQKSKNVILWMLNQYDNLNVCLDDFKSALVEGMCVLYRKVRVS